MNAPDILEYIRAALAPDMQTLARVEPILNQARQAYAGETLYIPKRDAQQRQTVTRRTLQRRARMA